MKTRTVAALHFKTREMEPERRKTDQGEVVEIVQGEVKEACTNGIVVQKVENGLVLNLFGRL